MSEIPQHLNTPTILPLDSWLIPLAGVFSLPRADHTNAGASAKQQERMERTEGNTRGQSSQAG